MASVDWQKVKTRNDVRGIVRHCMADTRAKTKHGNKEIDSKKSSYNLYKGNVSTYEEIMKKYDARLKYVDEHSPSRMKPRDNRVTMLSLSIPVPEGIETRREQIQFFNMASQTMNELFGAENIIGGAIHYDEIHDYKDVETKEMRTSRPHMHTFIMPVTEDGRMCAKEVCSRKNMVKLNNAIDARCEEQFHVKFNTGTKKKSYKTVESLKQESAYLELKDAAYEETYNLAYQNAHEELLKERRAILKEMEEYIEKISNDARMSLKERNERLKPDAMKKMNSKWASYVANLNSSEDESEDDYIWK